MVTLKSFIIFSWKDQARVKLWMLQPDFERDKVQGKKRQCSTSEFDKALPNRSLGRPLLLEPTRQQAARNKIKLGQPHTDRKVYQGGRAFVLAIFKHHSIIPPNLNNNIM